MKLKYFNGNNNFSSFTEDQAVAAKGIINFLRSEWEDGKFIISLSGSGGTGKTYLTNYIINNSGYASNLILCAAPTHKACRNLSKALGGKKVVTIQSVFGFRLDVDIDDFDPNNPAFTPKSAPKITSLHKVLLIDEASMLNRKLVKYIINYCRKLQIKIIFVGDDKQLAAPKDNDISAFKMSSKVFQLNQIVRQEESSPIKDLLSIIREDINNKTFGFLEYLFKNPECFNANNNGYKLIDFKNSASLIRFKFEDDDFKKDITLYKIIAYKNVRVNQWNDFVRKIVVKNSDTSVLTIDDLLMSYVTLVDEFNSIIFSNSEEYIVKDIVDTIDPKYQFKGFLIRFQCIYNGEITSPIFVINHNDNYTWQMYCKVVYEMINEAKTANVHKRSALWKEYFSFKKKYLSLKPIMVGDKVFIDRDLDYGFAITSHRSQGSTYGTVFVDLKDMIYDKNNHPFTDRDDVLRRIYVACSRASKQLYLIW